MTYTILFILIIINIIVTVRSSYIIVRILKYTELLLFLCMLFFVIVPNEFLAALFSRSFILVTINLLAYKFYEFIFGKNEL